MSGGSPQVSVVVVAYNEAARIGACLASLAAQQFREAVEYLLVDGDSSDDTIATACAQLPGLRVIHNPQRAISAARQLGWRAARGPLVGFLDADCIAPPHWLDRLVTAQRTLAADAVGGGNRPPSGETRFYDALRIALDSYVGAHRSVQGRCFRTACAVDHLPGLNVLYRRAALDAVGGYDPRFAFMGEDADLSWKLRKQGMRLYYVPDAEVIHRQHPGFLPWLRRMFRYGRGRAALMRKHSVADRRPPALQHVVPLLFPLMPGVHVPLVTLYGLYRGLRAGRPELGLDIALVLLLTHLGYGVGEWAGLLSRDVAPSEVISNAPHVPG